MSAAAPDLLYVNINWGNGLMPSRIESSYTQIHIAIWRHKVTRSWLLGEYLDNSEYFTIL